MTYRVLALAFTVLVDCKMSDQKTTENNETTQNNEEAENSVGSIERTNPCRDELVSKDAVIEIIGEGYEWSEGPVWVPQHKMLLFSDVPKNIVYKWTEEKGVEEYLTPSGYTGEGQYSREPGSNGLALSKDGKLILCQHGDRKIAAMDAPLSDPKPVFITLADKHDGKKLNSPNDVVVHSNGELYFTDPPYGLPNQAEDPTKESPYHGVYKINNKGSVTLLVDSLTRPNGIAFLAGERSLIVANSDPGKAMWYAFDLEGDKAVNARIFYDASPNLRNGERGLPDGLRVDSKGNVYATGPGGVWIFNGGGKVLGRIRLNGAPANCALSDDEKTLFITADMHLLRLKLRD